MKDPVQRSKAWAAMQRLEVFTSRQIEEGAGASAQSTQLYLRRLLAAGYVKLEQDRVGGYPRIYRLVRNSGPIAPYLETVVCDPNLSVEVADKKQRVWNAMRMLRVFRVGALKACGVSPKKVQWYLRRLERCGYLERYGFHKNYTFQLVRDTGVAAPLPHGDALFDVNTQQVYEVLEAGES